MEVLKLENVCKNINNKKIIDNISFNVKEGEICGLLGPNGAGKTTLIKMIVGLLTPDSGNIYVCNNTIKKERKKYISNLATIVENPEMYSYLSGIENLKQLARLDSNISNDDILKALEVTGLKDRMYDKFKTYSLGMKQRLGLAQVIMGEKKLWVLDEPTNGLDATGIIEFREIFKNSAKKNNISILISSHILSEIEVLCDKIVFINNGEIKSIENIKNIENDYETFEIKTNESEKYNNIMNKFDFIKEVTINKTSVDITIDNNSYHKLVELLINNNLRFDKIISKNKSLEKRYLEVIGNDSNNKE
ncbi:ABC transporter ATP-binding protein [Clostridium botulinum]|nr:ABC transporter ATP-binding protein [Clostridium botulinum]NFD33986.1 ABC transporter ATP-binding protein [Clostridium botulinum]NFD59092.1 ABC transporter ATP-binding protein [Clostridium botulinum]NFE02383.1 ABC transporter ATP-binding protein [Clostridium botulinum]